MVREPELAVGQDRGREGRYARARPPRIHHRGIRRLVKGQRPVRGRHGADPQRVPAGRRPDHARRALLAQLPDRDQPVLRLRLQDQLQPSRRNRGLPQAAERHHRRGSPADGRVDGAPPRRREVPHGLGATRARERLLPAVHPEARVRPQRCDERGHDHPGGAGRQRPRIRQLTMTPFLLAIDNGSQSTKVTIFDSRGHALASARRVLKPYDTSVPGHAIHPGDDIWDSIQEACRDAMAQFSGNPADIAAVGLCTIRFCRALLAEDGSLTEPLLSWMDERVSRPYEPRNPAVRYVTTSSGYITHRLTGQFVDAAANYQGVWPIDQDTATWSSDPAAYASTGMPRDMLFDLVPPGGRLGEVLPGAAEATGIPAGLPVYATANDKAVEALGSGLEDDGTVLLSLGIYIAAMTIGSSSRSAVDSYWVNFAARPGKYLYESTGIRRGMWMVGWYRTVLEGSLGEEPPTEMARLEEALD